MDKFKERLISELIELRSRLTLIYNFTHGNSTFKDLKLIIKFYLCMQLLGMKIYHKYLVKRMDYLGITNEHIDDYYTEETARQYLKNLKVQKFDKIVKDGRRSKENIK